MTTDNLKSIIELAKEQDCFLYMANEDGKIVNLSDESTETFLDKQNEILISVRTNSNIGNQNKVPFSTTFIEADSIKTATLELNLEQLMNVLKKRNITINDNIKNIINTQSGIRSASNYNIKYDEKTDKDGNKTLEEKISSIPNIKGF